MAEHDHGVAGKRPCPGPLGPHLDSFTKHLVALGYARKTRGSQLSLVRTFDRWLVRHDHSLTDLDAGVVDAFLRTVYGRLRRGGKTTLSQVLTHLRTQGVIVARAPVVDDSPRAQLERRYQRYLRAERGLVPTTVDTYLLFCRQFLTEQRGDAWSSLGTLSPSDIAAFVQRHARVGSVGRAQLMTTALRALCRFLFQTGEIAVDLSATVPTVPAWRLATLPRSLAADDVERLLTACDRQTPTGRRDYAILLLLARLGVRAGEVVALELDDLHWRTGEITIRGRKGLRHERFPLPEDVGDALATYVRDRPPSETRRVFLCMRAPRRSFRGPGAVTTIVRRALARADLHPAVRGAHLLRHSLATQMLRHGASFVEIGAVLRHRAAGATEIYAKVDLESLRLVVQPWPDAGGVQ
ncbi:MAG TPA: site-specific integrase [Gemmatimonadaceae bacterium]|nr:site-specific integrase [Gemmatimonadaceae bacterium]